MVCQLGNFRLSRVNWYLYLWATSKFEHTGACFVEKYLGVVHTRFLRICEEFIDSLYNLLRRTIEVEEK